MPVRVTCSTNALERYTLEMTRAHAARVLLLGLGLCALASAAPATSGDVKPDEFRSRRAALRKSIEGAMVLFGQREGSDVVTQFQQEPNFYYLAGWTEPGAILLLTPSEETLFLPHHDEHAER